MDLREKYAGAFYAHLSSEGKGRRTLSLGIRNHPNLRWVWELEPHRVPGESPDGNRGLYQMGWVMAKRSLPGPPLSASETLKLLDRPGGPQGQGQEEDICTP